MSDKLIQSLQGYEYIHWRVSNANSTLYAIKGHVLRKAYKEFHS